MLRLKVLEKASVVNKRGVSDISPSKSYYNSLLA